jgi:hypothetical protein
MQQIFPKRTGRQSEINKPDFETDPETKEVSSKVQQLNFNLSLRTLANIINPVKATNEICPLKEVTSAGFQFLRQKC